jgi:hypothetical protein
MAQVLQEYGITIEENVSDDLWTRYPIRKSGISRKDAESMGQVIRQRHRELIGDATVEYSTTEFMKDNIEVVKQYFNTYLMPLSQATNSGQNNLTMQSLSGNILETADRLKPEVKQGLLRIANSKNFNDSDARLMESMIRYALVEELRKRLPTFFSSGAASSINKVKKAPSSEFSSAYVVFSAIDYQRNFDNAMQLANNIKQGVAAGRYYGGCTPGDPNSTLDYTGPQSIIPSLQNVFGGKTENEESQGPVGRDGKGPLNFKCSKGHTNTRKDGEPLVPKCRVCREDVGCGPTSQIKNKNADKSSAVLIPLLQKDYKKNERRQAA